MPTEDWFYVRNGGAQVGPVTSEGLRELLARGELQPTDLVWNSSMANWAAATAVPGLATFEMPTPAAPRIVPPPPPTGMMHAQSGAPMPLGYAGAPQAYSVAPDIGQDAGMRWLIPVGRSGWALVAGYLGLLSVLLVFAPFALITGLVAVSDIRKHPQRHGMGRAIFGIVMGGLFSVVGVIALIMSFSRHSRF